MLEIIKVAKRSDALSHFSRFLPETETWLVPDLRSKSEIQLRSKSEIQLRSNATDQRSNATDQRSKSENSSELSEDSVLRASDFWGALFAKSQPHKKTLDSHWARVLLSEFLKNNKTSLNLHQGSAALLLEMIDFFLPLLCHPEGHEKFLEWLDQHPLVKEKWGEWYLLTKLSFKYLYEEKNLVLPTWYSALLVAEGKNLEWDRPLWVDFGGHLRWSEAELFKILSRSVDVRVFQVEGSGVDHWQKDFAHKMKPYQSLQSLMKKTSPPPVPELTESKTVEVKKFSGQLAEIREAVGQVRVWLDQGVPLGDIGIIAPDIEDYWPVLRGFLDKEGLHYKKEVRARLSSWPSVQEWLARLRLQIKDIRTSDLETHYFRSSEPFLSHEEFRSLFTNILDEEDLRRHQEVAQNYHQNYLGREKLSSHPTSDEWILFISRLWNPTSDKKNLSLILAELYKFSSPEWRLSKNDWLDLLENIACRKEVVVKEAAPEGLHLVSLFSAPAFDLKKRIFLGLSEESLKSDSSPFLSRFEVDKLLGDLGFYLENPELSVKEFELLSLADCQSEHDIFSFGMVSLSGELQTPSGFWLKLSKEEIPVTRPQTTKWDQIQAEANLSSRMRVDLGLESSKSFRPTRPPSLSPSRVEKFLDCSFRFASEALFHLRDLPEVDLHLDPRSYGNIVHDIFEKLTVEPRRWDYSEKEIEELVNLVFESKHKHLFYIEMWPAFRKKIVQLTLRFLKFERDWNRRFPETKTLAQEKPWGFKIKNAEGSLQVEDLGDREDQNAFYISGKIDRIDGDASGNRVVLDYKSSLSSAENHAKWFEKNKLQLLFYIWALEKESQGQNPVVGAFYYVFKTMERQRGLAVKELGENLFPVEGRFGALTDIENKNKLVADLEKTLLEIMQKVQSGQFSVEPREEELCTRCHCKTMCRAPHLR